MESLITPYPLQPVNVLQCAAIIAYAFACALLWPNERVRALCGLLLLQIFSAAFNFSEETRLWGQSYLITPVFTLCTGPAFYVFVRHLVYADSPWRKTDALHLVPAALALPFTAFSQSVIALGTVSVLCYGLAAFLLVRRYTQASLNLSSNANAVRLGWLIRIMLVFVVLGLTDAIRLNLQPVLPYTFLNTWYLGHTLAVFVLYLSLIFCALHQAELFDGLQLFEEFNSSKVSPDDNLDKDLFIQLDHIVKQQQLYCRQRLTLQELADELGWQSKEVSGVINNGADRNFNDYINGLRVKKVQSILRAQAEEKVNLLTIGLEAGFNSKTNFNTSFKQLTGSTPSQYLKSLRKKTELERSEA